MLTGLQHVPLVKTTVHAIPAQRNATAFLPLLSLQLQRNKDKAAINNSRNLEVVITLMMAGLQHVPLVKTTAHFMRNKIQQD